MTSENYRNERSYQKYFMEGVYNLSGWKPFLHHLKGYYASHDKFRTIVDDHYEHQLSMKHYYVNLVLVTEDCHTEVVENLRVEENSREREERYQAMLLSGQTLGVEELYRDLNRSEEAGWISITGRAGTGKTTLLQYISHCWGAERKGAWHNRFDFVFRVQLNLLKGYTDKKDLTTLEMLRQIILESFEKTDGYDEVLSKANIDGCLKEKSFRNRSLLLLDGFDEIQGLYNDNHKHIKDFIDDVMRQFPNGIMATRPDVLPKTLLTKFKHQYENVGFSVDNVYQYVDKYFQVDELEHKESLLAALHANPEMVSLAQVPIHAHILCLIWKGNAEKLSNTHLTMTQLYHELMLWLIKRYCYKFKALTERSPEQLFKICAQEISTLCEIAYNAFVDNSVQFIKGDFIQEQVKSSSFMDVLSKQFGVLRAFNEKEMGYAEYYYFIHLTCQEFFVALYIAKHLSVKPSPHRQQEIERRQKVLSLVQEIAKNRDIRRYEIIWIFLAGLVSSVPEYAKGADCFWDAIIEFPTENVQALTFHPHLNILKSKQRLCREAFLTLRHNNSISMPQRLSELRTRFQHLHLWQGVQQTEALMRTWHKDDTDSVAAKTYQNIQQQYQTDALALGFGTKPAVSLPTFMMKMPVYRQSVVDLLEKCEDISKNVRVTKALGLGYLGVKDPAIIQDLLQDLLRNENWSVRLNATRALGQLGVKDPAIIQDLRDLLKDKEWPVRKEAAIALGELRVKDPVIIQDLRDLLKDKEWPVHSYAVLALAKSGVKDPDIIQYLRDLLKDKDACVSGYAAHTLGQLGAKAPAIIQDLRYLLKDKEVFVRGAAAHALGQLGVKDPAIIQDLRYLLKNKDEYVRRDAAHALGQLGVKDPAIIQDLRYLLKDKEEFVRKEAAIALGELRAKDPAIIQDLRYLLKDKEWPVRCDAAVALGQLGVKDPAIIQDLRYLLKDKEEFVRRDAAVALGQLGVKDPAIIQDLRYLLKDEDRFVRRDAAVALGQLGVKDPATIQDLRYLLKDKEEFVRRNAAHVLGQLGVKDPAIIQDLQDLSHDKEKSVRGASIEALKYLNALTLEMCLELLKIETTAKIYIEIYIALLRIKPEHYAPFLANNTHPDLVYLFISALYFQGAVLVQKEGQLFLNDTLLTADPGMIQSLYSAAEWFTDAMNEYSESIQSMRLPIEAPSITSVLTEDFLTIDLPIDELSELQQWKATIEPSFSILSYRVAIMEQDITLIKKELDRIGQKMESDWERAQEALTGEDVAYIKTFKKHLVQMYIIATVAASGEVQTTLTATTSSVVTVLDTIAGLVPWGGEAVEILSSLIQTIDLKIKQKRMERITHLGDTPEEVAKMATILGQRLLHCLEIEHYVQDGRIARLFNTLSVLTQKYQDGFYNTLFSVLTQNKTETTLSSPSDMEIRAKNDAQLLLSAIMEKDVPHVQENQVDIDCLFLYSAPLLTVIEQIFDRMKTQYCNKHRYKLADIEIKRKAEFCAAVANQCQEQAHNAAAHIEDAAKRAVFIEKLATEFNSHRNPLYQSKALNTWSVFGKTTTLSINKDILDPKIMAATYTNALIK